MKTLTVLCPVNFSPASNEAVRWAVAMVQSMDGHLTILHAYRLLQAKNGQAPEVKRKTEEEAIYRFSLLEQELLKGKNIAYDFRIEVGFIADRIEDHIRRNALSMIVMDKEMSVGSEETFAQLMEHLKVPLVIVP